MTLFTIIFMKGEMKDEMNIPVSIWPDPSKSIEILLIS